MKRPLILAIGLAALACDSTPTEPVAPESLRVSASQGAITELAQFTVLMNFQAYAACFDAFATIGGPIDFSVRTVTRPDGSRHLTVLMDVSKSSITYNGTVWRPGQNAFEMFSRNIPAGALGDQLTEHQGTVVYRSPDGQPDLRFVHRIHLVRLPDGTVQLNNNIFSIVCIAPNN